VDTQHCTSKQITKRNKVSKTSEFNVIDTLVHAYQGTDVGPLLAHESKTNKKLAERNSCNQIETNLLSPHSGIHVVVCLGRIHLRQQESRLQQATMAVQKSSYTALVQLAYFSMWVPKGHPKEILKFSEITAHIFTGQPTAAPQKLP